MPDLLDSDGLQTKTLAELVTDLETGFRDIYGDDINLDQNSPDGQIVNIFAASGIDIRELLTGVYNSFDPDRAVGIPLDERVTINNIERKGGTFTITPVTITTDRTVNLAGLDGSFNDINGTGYTVADDAGTEYILIDTQTLVSGVHVVNFRASAIGQVETTLNTITNPVTIILGVTTIDNPSAALDIGQNEETDAELRLRRQQSVALSSTGYLNGLLGEVLNLSGVTDAVLFENVTNAIDADGIPAHGIWLIAEGGSNTDIANLIYVNKSYGSNMKGDVEIDILTDSGVIFVAKFDRPVADDLFVRFDIQPTTPSATFDQAAIKQYMVDNLDFAIGQAAETSSLTCLAVDAIAATGGGGVPINMEVSDDDATWIDFLETATKDLQWTLDTSRITITVV